MSPTVAPPTSDELHDIWRTRPVRSGGDAMLAGVCSGIARRYDVDPTLVRVALVVAAVFGGSGVLAYIACWFVLPGDGVDNPRRGRRLGRSGMAHEMHRPGTVALVVVAVVVLAVLPTPAWGSSGLAGAVLLLIGVWALHRRTPEPPPGTSVDTNDGVSLTKPVVSPSGSGGDTEDVTDRVVPPAWDPLGAAPFAWDLPEPPTGSPAPPRPARDTALAVVVVGLALVVAAVGTALFAAGVAGVTPLRIAAASLAVIAVGVVAGALRGRRTGLTGIAALLAAVVVVLGVSHSVTGLPGGGVGDRTWRPLTENDIASRYSLTVGSATLDLRSVTLTADRTVRIEAGVGEIVVDVPAGMNVRELCRVTVGDQSCPSGVQGGDDGTAGPVLTVDASAVAGKIEVNRG
ncbi:PspC domain-containing protein [Williamsia sp. SKLECPSW1]